jgi:hypothetical protein
MDYSVDLEADLPDSTAPMTGGTGEITSVALPAPPLWPLTLYSNLGRYRTLMIAATPASNGHHHRRPVAGPCLGRNRPSRETEKSPNRAVEEGALAAL